MRISDWSSDVCSSDLQQRLGILGEQVVQRVVDLDRHVPRRLLLGQLVLAAEDFLAALAEIDAGGLLRDRIGRVRRQRRHHFLQRGQARATIRVFRGGETRSEEHTSELQSLMRISYAVFCLKKKNQQICKPTVLFQTKYYTTEQ